MSRFTIFENRALFGLFRLKVQKVIGEYSPNNKLMNLKWRWTQNFSQKTRRQDTSYGTCSCMELRIAVTGGGLSNEPLGFTKFGEFLE